MCAWIVDYKTSSHEGADREGIPRTASRDRYRAAARILTRGPSVRPKRCSGSTFPLLAGWRQVAGSDGSQHGARASSPRLFSGTAVVIANVGLRYLDPARAARSSAFPRPTLLCFGVARAFFLFRGEGWERDGRFAIFAMCGIDFSRAL